MAKETKKYKCDYCSREFETLRGANQHERVCDKNPAKKARQENEISAEIENIRLTATSPQHLIKLITDFLLKCGIQINFRSYPSRFSMKISNSHNAPKGYSVNRGATSDHKGVPRGYPGWSGQWVGSIKVIDRTKIGEYKEPNFSDLISGGSFFGRKKPSLLNDIRLWFLQTGTGCSGSNFNISGMIWLYDFPKMQEEFEKNNQNFDIIEDEFMDMLTQYHELYQTNRENFIKNNEKTIEINNIINEIQKLSSKARDIATIVREKLKNEYNSKNSFKMPEIPSAFLKDNEKIMKIYGDVSYNRIEDTKTELPGIVVKLNSIANVINNYVKEHPEEFI